jgi:hypothetical protein
MFDILNIDTFLDKETIVNEKKYVLFLLSILLLKNKK